MLLSFLYLCIGKRNDNCYNIIVEKKRSWIMMKYKVWSANMWNEDLLQEVIAIFYDLEKAVEYVEYQLSLGRSCVIKQDGKKIDID